MHKGWLAFGVELDSFCERDTIPANSSIPNVGMASLLNSKLYGETIDTPRNANLSGTHTNYVLSPTGCSASTLGDCTGYACPAGVRCTGTPTFTPYRPIGSGPGKDNFIGFGVDNCADKDLENRSEKAPSTNRDSDCDLNVTTYKMGVYGHLSGKEYVGFSIQNNGIISGETRKDTSTDDADANCS